MTGNLQVDETDLGAVTALLASFSRAAGSDDGNGVVAAGLKLAGVCGFRGLQDVVERCAERGTDELHRDWRRLADLTRLAAQREDLRTVALAFLFADLWQSQVAPDSSLGDLDEIGFPTPPAAVQADFAVLALAFLADQDPSWIVAKGTTATIRTIYVLDRAARLLVDLNRTGVPVKPSFLEVAHRILDR
jgi:hypothetical protein